jgi:DNA-binding NarL/FixJ family response regulator
MQLNCPDKNHPMRIYSNINIVMADDDELFRIGFRCLLEKEDNITLVAEASDGYGLLNQVSVHRPDIVITGINLPGMDGIAATKQIVSKFPGVAVIALSTYELDHYLIDMLEAGASGYLLKRAGGKMIIEAIRQVSKNHSFFCHQTGLNISRLVAMDMYDPHKRQRKNILSERESEVLRLLCLEKTNSQIAEELRISLRTVEGIRLKLQSKTKTRNLVGLYKFALKYGVMGEMYSQAD